jgi:SAM-dependent methyltransferase
MNPELYHLHHENYLEDLPFWLTLADQTSGPILELGCGTGRVMSTLRREGFNVFGLDYDQQMLDHLKQIDPDAPVFLADLTNFQLDLKFSLILLPCNTYSTLTAAQRKSALGSVCDHLTPGGIFAFSLPNPADLIEMGNSDEAGIEESFILPDTQTPVQVSSSWETVENTVTIYWHYDQLLADGRVKRTTHLITHQLDPVETYLEETKAAGFILETFGEFDRTPYHPEADFLIVEAKK